MVTDEEPCGEQGDEEGQRIMAINVSIDTEWLASQEDRRAYMMSMRNGFDHNHGTDHDAVNAADRYDPIYENRKPRKIIGPVLLNYIGNELGFSISNPPFVVQTPIRGTFHIMYDRGNWNVDVVEYNLPHFDQNIRYRYINVMMKRKRLNPFRSKKFAAAMLRAGLEER